MLICASCGQESSEEARFCLACGVRLGEVPAARELRKTVTVLFSDVTGSTAIGERLDAEPLRQLMLRWYEEMKAVCEAHGGRVRGLIGDAVMAAFGVPAVHEDDALRAVRAAAQMRERLETLNDELERDFGLRVRSRTGVNTGEVIVRDPDPTGALALGDAVNVAARLEQAAQPGDVLLGEATYRLVEDAVTAEPVEPLSLKGKAEPVPAFRLLDVLPHAEALVRHFEMPLVGRELELAQLRQAYQRAVRERRCHLVTVFGLAGIGKTRLSQELAGSVASEAGVLTGRCLSYGEGITYWPLREIVAQAAGDRGVRALLEDSADADAVAERIESAIGTGTGRAAKEEVFWAVRRLVEALALEMPLLLVFEDIQWAEPTLLDLIEYLADWVRDVPVLVVSLARPELLDERPSWGGGKLNATSVLLDPLSAQESSLLIGALPAAVELAPEARARITAAAQGNPLFLEQMLAMLAQDGDADGDINVPPAIQALLSARLERLEPGQRHLLECASIEGEVFQVGGVIALSPPESREAVTSRLMSLVRKELIRADSAALPGDEAFRFRHALIRDAAYTELPKQTRAALHEHFASWLETTHSERLTEHEEILGYHLEQAAAYHHELGDAADAQRIAEQASTHLAAAGRGALASGDLPAAANLLCRAADILPADEPRRIAIRLQSIPALFETGRLEQADSGVDEILAHSADRTLLLAARAWRGYLAAVRGRGTSQDGAASAQGWLAACEEAGDHAGQATALGVLAKMHFWSGQAAAAEEIWQRAAEQAARAADHRAEADALVWLLISAMLGPTPVEAALERCEAIASRPSASRKVRVMASIEQGVLEAMQGHTARGRELVARGREQLDELGLALLAETMAHEAAIVEQMAGDLSAAETVLRPAYRRLEEIGATGRQQTVAGMLSCALHAQGRFDEAKRFAELSRDAPDGDFDPVGSAARALVAAHEGEDEAAFQLAEDAVTRASRGDWLWVHADYLVVLADVHTLAGRSADAVAALAQADELYKRKGCVAALKWTATRRSALPDIP